MSSTHTASPAPTLPAGRPAGELSDEELETQGTRAHETRNWVFLHGTAEQFAHHTSRMLALEEEYLRRYPHRTWQGIEEDTEIEDAPIGRGSTDPVLLVLAEIAASPGGRLHKLEVHQLARRSGLDRSSLAGLYTASEPLLTTDQQDRVITEAGRHMLRNADRVVDKPAPGSARGVYTWRYEERAEWDADKQRIVGGAPTGVFDVSYRAGENVPGAWWAATDSGSNHVLGYGWMDVTWGEAEILLAVAPEAQQGGVGSFILNHLEREAAQRGLNYVYNTVLETHPQRAEIQDWLGVRGYRGDGEDEALRKKVDPGDRPSTQTHAASPTVAVLPSSLAASAHSGSDLGPGREDRGGYVDVDEHQY